MNWKTLAGAISGAISLGALMGVAMLAVGMMAQSASASPPVTLPGQMAQAAQATATAVPATPRPSTTAQPGKPGWPKEHGLGPGPGFGPGFEGRGPGHRGFDGGYGRFGGLYTADGASRVISATGSLITLVKDDLAYATGKMDTSTIEDWLNRADGLLRSAQSASSGGQYGQAVETANAAGTLARAADMLMQQELGAANLPSNNQRPLRGKGHAEIGPGTASGVTQARASRDLAGFYDAIVMQEALLNRATNKGDAATYLNAAKDYYRTAHAAYQAGNYDQAYASVAVGRTLLSVANSLLRAGIAPNSPDAPVQVPAPNF